MAAVGNSLITRWPVRCIVAAKNLLTVNQATIETDATGWAAQLRCSIARTTAEAAEGSAALVVTATAGAYSQIGTSTYAPVRPGATYTLHLAAKGAASTAWLFGTWYNAAGTGLGNLTSLSAGVLSDTGWKTVTQNYVAPANAASVQFRPLIGKAGGAAFVGGEVCYLDKMGVWEGTSTDWVTPGPVTLSSRWRVAAVIGDTLTARWKVRALASDQVTALWDTFTTAARTLTSRWATWAGVGVQVTARWGVVGVVGQNLVSLWRARALVTEQVQVRWNTRQAIPTALRASWRIKGSVGKDRALKWAITTRVPVAPIVFRWAVRAPAGDTLTARWKLWESGRRLDQGRTTPITANATTRPDDGRTPRPNHD